MAANGNEDGYDVSSQNYFSDLKRDTGINIVPPKKQSFGDARNKLSYEAFEFLLDKANQERRITGGTWKDMIVRAIDGTKVTVPRSDDILEHFKPPKSKAGFGHYPQALMVTAINVFTGQPVIAEIANHRASERDLLMEILNQFSPTDLSLLDRGFGGDWVFLSFEEKNQNYLVRMKGGKTAAIYVQKFLESGKKSQIVTLWVKNEEGEKKEIKLRLVRGPFDSEGKRIVFATNLLDEKLYSHKSILKLYRRRWGVETMYARSKNLLKLEQFHSRNYNGVMQEIFANLIIISLTAYLIFQTIKTFGMDPEIEEPSFKNAARVVRRHFFTAISSKKLSKPKALDLAAQMIEEVFRILWKKQPGRSHPRVSKQPIKCWNLAKNKKIKEFNEKLN